MASDIGQILYDFFGKAIPEGGQFTAIEYAVYGVIMLVLAFFVIYPILDRKGIKFNYRFMLALLPYRWHQGQGALPCPP